MIREHRETPSGLPFGFSSRLCRESRHSHRSFLRPETDAQRESRSGRRETLLQGCLTSHRGAGNPPTVLAPPRDLLAASPVAGARETPKFARRETLLATSLRLMRDLLTGFLKKPVF